MNLEDYFDFDNPNGIRIKGTRVNIEDVIFAAERGKSAQEIAESFRSLNLAQVTASLEYYDLHKVDINKYIEKELAEFDEEQRNQGERSEVVQRLLRMREESAKQVAS